jgi:hypothetical protein
MKEEKPPRDIFDQIFAPLLADETFAVLGLTPNATREEVMQAFRQKVKAMADGKGGYTGDMDKLIKAKEQALKCLEQ